VVSVSPLYIRPCFVLRQMSGQPHQRIGTATRSVDQSLKSARHLEDPKLIISETKIIVQQVLGLLKIMIDYCSEMIWLYNRRHLTGSLWAKLFLIVISEL